VEPGLSPAGLAGTAGSTVVAWGAVAVRRHVSSPVAAALALVMTMTVTTVVVVVASGGGCLREASGEVRLLARGLQRTQQGTCLLTLWPAETLQSMRERERETSGGNIRTKCKQYLVES